MEWNEETIQRLRSLWQEGLSTAEIGRRMSITKNAVVGKAHRLVLSARPSPIRKVVRLGDAGPAQAVRPARAPPAAEASGSVTLLTPRPAMQAGAADPRFPDDGNQAQTNVTPLRAGQGSAGRPSPPATATPVRPSASSRDTGVDAPRHEPPAGASASRPIGEPIQRRRSQSCCWPLGDPGTKQFRFCGGEPIPGKPYCVEHAQLAYVKLRDRRDTVA